MATLAGLMALTGCNKTANTAAKGPVIRGVLVETPRLQQAFAGNTTPEVQNVLGRVQMGIRYGDFQTAVAELEKLAANPALSEPQKKAATDVAEQLKQVISKPEEAPKQ